MYRVDHDTMVYFVDTMAGFSHQVSNSVVGCSLMRVGLASPWSWDVFKYPCFTLSERDLSVCGCFSTSYERMWYRPRVSAVPILRPTTVLLIVTRSVRCTSPRSVC